MRISVSIELLTHLAQQEAVAGQFQEVQPEHFCMALLRFSELSVQDLDKIPLGPGLSRELAEEVENIRRQFQACVVDSTQVRRALRDRLGRGQGPFNGGQLHRSAASRELFEAAVRLADEANSEVLSAAHLLRALLARSTPLMAEFITKAPPAPSETPEPISAPLLDQHGRDLLELAAAGALPPSHGREAESRSLGLTLGRPDVRLVFLISDEQPPVGAVVTQLAQLMANGRERAIPNKRLVDLTPDSAQVSSVRASRQLLQDILTSAATQNDLVLVFSLTQKDEEDQMLLDELRPALSAGKYQVVCPLRETFYRDMLARDPAWKRMAEVIWIEAGPIAELPDEL